eukprot:1553317-Heterocapsa_arctica.AAC.1
MSSVKSAESDDPTAMLYLGVARSRAAFRTGASKAGAFSAGAAWGSVACRRLAGGPGTACLAVIAI